MNSNELDASWDQLSLIYERILFDSLTSKRIPLLERIQTLLEADEIPEEDLKILSLDLLKTYNYYQDSNSRDALLNTLEVLIYHNSKFLLVIIKFINQVSVKSNSSLAVTDYLTLLTWVNKFIKLAEGLDRDNFMVAIQTQAILLSNCIDKSYTAGQNSKSSNHKKRIFESVLSTTKYGITQTLLNNNAKLEEMVDAVISKNNRVDPGVAITFIGVLTDAVVSINPIVPSITETFNATHKSTIVEFYVNQVLLNKIPPSSYALEVFSPFINHFIKEDDLEPLFTAVEKAIMRSSETSFGSLVPLLFKGVSKDINFSAKFVSSKLFSSILAGLKSAKENVRNRAFESLEIGIQKSEIPDDILLKLVEEVFKTTKSTTNADAKSLLINTLSLVKTENADISNKILQDLLPIISKDQNEISLSCSVHIFVNQYMRILVKKMEIPKEANVKFHNQIKTGLSEKKLNLRKVWMVELGDYIYKNESSLLDIMPFIEETYPLFVKSLQEAQASPLPTLTGKGISCSYVAICISELIKDKFTVDEDIIFTKSLLNNGERPSILCNSKVYTKLSNRSELIWFGRALKSTLHYASKLEENNQIMYGKTWIYSAISRNISNDLKLDSLSLLKLSVKICETEFSNILIKSIYTILEDFDKNQDQELFNFDFKRLSPIFSILTQDIDSSVIKSNLTGLLIASHHKLIPIKNSWVGLAQRGNIDIGEIVEINAQQIIMNIFEFLKKSAEGNLYQASLKAVSNIAFIRPEIIAPSLSVLIEKDLDVEKIEHIDNEKLSIWKGNEGELVIDVLNASTKKLDDANSKDYETRKWEESLKKELAVKGKIKLTREQQTVVNGQLEKESIIRSDVNKTLREINRGINIVNELSQAATQVENGAKYWYPVSISRIFTLAKHALSAELFSRSIIDSFLQLSELVSSRLGSLKLFIGVAILRLNDVAGLSENYTTEPIIDLIGRILFRVKILSDQNPLDSLSLSYILPLLSSVLENGKEIAIKNSFKKAVTSEFLEEDPEEEQLLLAVEIISLHSEVFEDDSIPRSQILEVLISLMRLPSKAKIAKECFLSMCQHISINISKEDLKILFDNIISPEVFVRTSILEGIDSEFDLTNDMRYSNELWIAAHDNDLNCANLAVTIWDDNEFQIVNDAPLQLLKFADNKDTGLRLSVAKSLFAAIKALKEIGEQNIFEKTLQAMFDLYHVKKNPPPPVLDKFGLAIRSSRTIRDTWEERSTIALTLKFLAPLFEKSSLEDVFKFLIEEKALGDKEELVRQELQEAGVEIIKIHGFENIETLIPIFESNLTEKDTGTATQDHIKESVIILYGALARHLDESDSRLNIIVDRLIKTLDTPSEEVQYAISECLAPLVNSIEPKLGEYFDTLFDKLFNGKKFASRRGAAYGIAGLVKGAGIKSLSTFDIIRNLTDAADDKKSVQKREGASFAFECMSQSLGKFFEPYVIEVLPIILKSLGDLSPEVREATDAAARQIMKNTTSYGVKKLIPVAISNLDEIAWRSKKGSVELLGSMAYLDPTQLSASLSTIVPEIVGVLNDTHKEVRKAADQALKRFGEVIRNPEIQVIVPDLINAIGDPTKYTDVALDKLIKTQFVHYIDGPSLALIIHVIHRGMRDRSAAIKKKACQIVGNMAILVDSKDLKPYLSTLISELEVSMVDPVPATRSTAARALGSLVEKLGEEQFPDLIPRLLNTLQDERKTGDRLGSAQALAEVISGLGINKLEELLPTILSAATSPRPHIRSGFMPLLLFLPVCFGSQFSQYLTKIIPPILAGLADVDEDIRDTALRAGRLIVKNYAKKAVDLLLPELEVGLSDSNYRIRLSSVELTGDLLFQVTGISGKNELLEEQSEFSGEINNNLIEVLGQERRDRVLSLLFVCRSDVTGIVRSASVDIWKALVANTPRTIKEILPTLTAIIVRRLASSDEVQRTIAAQTLGEMVRRVGANALSQLLPTLEESLISSDSDAKQGICIALTELIKSTSHEGLVAYQDVFIGTIRDALVDPNTRVREAAAKAFESLQEELGKVVIDEIIPHLLNMLESKDSENALLALQDIMAAKSEVIFPLLLSTLLSPPIDSFKAKALSSLASVAGSALYKKLSLIINTLVNAVIASKDQPEENQNEIKSAFDSILLSIEDDEGVHPLMQQLLSLVKHEDSAKRAVIYERLGSFFSGTNLDYSVYLQDMVSQFILSLGDKSPEVVKGTFDALTALVKRQSKDSLERLVKPAYQALSITGVKGEDLAAFTLPKGPNCILPIFLHGLMYGNAEQKELSALGIADINDKTPAINLKPFATVMTGPLIRVIGEKVSSDIKAGILVALNNLLLKIPQFLRPFIPQLQRTFVRSLSDGQNDKLRSKAVIALGSLIQFQPRVDSLVTELVTGARNSDDKGVKTAMLKAMLEVVNKAGNNMNEASKTSIMSLVEEEITEVDDRSAVSYARLLGSLSKTLSSAEASEILKSKILDKDPNVAGKFSILSLNSFLKYSPNHVFETGFFDDIVSYIINCSNSSNPYISDNAAIAIGKILLLLNETNSPFSDVVTEGAHRFEIKDETVEQLVNQLAKISLAPISNSPDTRRLTLVVIRTVARFKFEAAIKPYFDILAPSVFSSLRDPIIPIKLAAEKAFLAVFRLIEDPELALFNSWFNGKTEIKNILGSPIVPRSIGDYTKRVGSRLAGVERERIEAGGDAETVFSDRYEDESEVWAVGGVDLASS